ncbi:MAG: trehalose-phosphatase [Dehalococcoidia bacterium]|nr:MAG: trehalose-phosphatase [Dehalococcoidia bacterium]
MRPGEGRPLSDTDPVHTDVRRRLEEPTMAIPVHEPAVLAPALRRPFGLFVNLNGTIAPIAPNPDEVRVAEPARRALLQLVDALDVVVIVTGAPVEQAHRLVGIDGILYLGNHGAEQIRPDGERRLVGTADDRLRRAAEDAVRRVGERKVSIEPKGRGIGIHFRSANNPRAVRKQLLAALQAGEHARHYRLVEGRCLLELRPVGERDKGDAVSEVLTERGIKGGLYIGDDRSDLPAFRAVRHLRDSGGFGIAVGVANDETRDAITDAADFLVDDIPGVVRILNWLTSTLGRPDSSR